MRRFLICLLLCLGLGLSSCDPIVVEKTSETLSRGVYAIADCLAVGDVYHAAQYLAGVEKIVPSPKNRIKIYPIYSNGIGYVLLGDNLTGKKVIIVGSDDFNKLIAQGAINNKLKISVENYQKEADAQVIKNEQALNTVVVENNKLKADELRWHNSIFYKAYLFFTTLTYIIPISIIAILAVCFFCPPLVAPIMAFLGTLAGVIWRIAISIVSGIIGLFVKKN